MADDAIELFRMLVDAGATPGEDFSYDLQRASAQISDRALEKLKLSYPDVDWLSICERIEIDPNLPIDHLNTYLGIDFVERLLLRIEQRLQQVAQGELAKAEAAWYLQQVLGGVEQRTNVPLYVLLQKRLPLQTQATLETLLRQPTAPCYMWMHDLVEAAGGNPTDVELRGDEATLTQVGLALLTTVWVGEYDLVEQISEAVAEEHTEEQE
ncbi:MAG: hypothetical protein HC800_18380 [Phormidesmis sp. RL_2_1]|nr:hypothetical protein [Phormidesmis sp. RL_2_1]